MHKIFGYNLDTISCGNTWEAVILNDCFLPNMGTHYPKMSYCHAGGREFESRHSRHYIKF